MPRRNQFIQRGHPMPDTDLAGILAVIAEILIGQGPVLVADQPVSPHLGWIELHLNFDIVRQGMGTWSDASARYVTDWKPITLPPILWVNTVILLASSFTLAMARRALARQLKAAPRRGGSPVPTPALVINNQHPIPWLGITFVLGVGFLVGQLLAWGQMQHLGIFVSTNPSSSFFYVLTGAHGIHLLGGVLALAYASLISLLRKPLVTRFLVVDVTALYWHFMDFLWIYIFALLHFAR